jgi:hypothetical protein
VSSGLRRRSEKNSFSNASWLSVRISSWLITTEPRTASSGLRRRSEKQIIFPMHDSNLELVDNKRVPNSRVGKGVDQKKKFQIQVGSGRVSNLELVDNKRAPEPRRVG